MSKVYTKSTIKHRRIVNKIIKGKEPAKAYMEVYPKASELSAKDKVSRMLSSEQYKKDIGKALDAQGLSLINVNKKLEYILQDPTKPVVIGKDIHQVEDKRLLLDSIKEVHKLHKIVESKPNVLIDKRSITYNAGNTDNTKLLQKIAKTIEALSIDNSQLTGELIEVIDVSESMDDTQTETSPNTQAESTGKA